MGVAVGTGVDVGVLNGLMVMLPRLVRTSREASQVPKTPSSRLGVVNQQKWDRSGPEKIIVMKS